MMSACGPIADVRGRRGKIRAKLTAMRCASSSVSRRNLGGKFMEWFSRKTSIAGVQVPNWMVVLGAIIVILIIYSFIH